MMSLNVSVLRKELEHFSWTFSPATRREVDMTIDEEIKKEIKKRMSQLTHARENRFLYERYVY